MTVVNQKVDFIFPIETAGDRRPYRKHSFQGVASVSVKYAFVTRVPIR